MRQCREGKDFAKLNDFGIDNFGIKNIGCSEEGNKIKGFAVWENKIYLLKKKKEKGATNG